MEQVVKGEHSAVPMPGDSVMLKRGFAELGASHLLITLQLHPYFGYACTNQRLNSFNRGIEKQNKQKQTPKMEQIRKHGYTDI